MDERLKKQLDFALEIDKEKNIFRQTHGLSFAGIFQRAGRYYQGHAYVSDP